MSYINVRQEGLDFDALLEIDAFDRPASHRAWIISGDIVANATNEDYHKFQEWIQGLGGHVTAISQLENTQTTDEGWRGIDVADLDSGVILLSRPVFDTAGKKIKVAKNSIGVAYNKTAYPRRASQYTDKDKDLPLEIVETEREGWIQALAPMPGYVSLEVLKYASQAGLLKARLEGFGRASQRVIDAVIQHTDAMLHTISGEVE